ncbi:5-oxoprolinase subunit PxpB [Corticicoccus populi]|uniref:5-oxoprolinase subunit PxpB n=1 Tax=Corticicoccus populi TaxID=1812821 RepID=A0ABW5WXB4_9STAP
MEIKQFSENTVTVYLGDEIDEKINRKLVQLKHLIEEKEIDGVDEIIVSYTSLIVNFDVMKTSAADLAGIIEGVDVDALLDAPFKYKVIEIPVCYGGDYGPDLDRFEETGLSPDEVIELHSGREYLVYMLGFMPGFPYLGGLDERLYRDRLENPRTKVPKGAVGIGGRQTGMYPFESPGGWNLLGRTPIPLFDPKRERPILYSPGDRIVFKQIDEEEYRKIEEAVKKNDYSVSISKEEES